jgi:predicted secreted protein
MKRAFVLLGILVLAFSLIACGSNTASENTVNTVENNTEASNDVAENTVEAPEATTETQEETKDESQDEAQVLAKGKKVPDYNMTTLDGETVSLHDYDGQIILLNFWATW